MGRPRSATPPPWPPCRPALLPTCDGTKKDTFWVDHDQPPWPPCRLALLPTCDQPCLEMAVAASPAADAVAAVLGGSHDALLVSPGILGDLELAPSRLGSASSLPPLARGLVVILHTIRQRERADVSRAVCCASVLLRVGNACVDLLDGDVECDGAVSAPNQKLCLLRPMRSIEDVLGVAEAVARVGVAARVARSRSSPRQKNGQRGGIETSPRQDLRVVLTLIQRAHTNPGGKYGDSDPLTVTRLTFSDPSVDGSESALMGTLPAGLATRSLLTPKPRPRGTGFAACVQTVRRRIEEHRSALEQLKRSARRDTQERNGKGDKVGQVRWSQLRRGQIMAQALEHLSTLHFSDACPFCSGTAERTVSPSRRRRRRRR